MDTKDPIEEALIRKNAEEAKQARELREDFDRAREQHTVYVLWVGEPVDRYVHGIYSTEANAAAVVQQLVRGETGNFPRSADDLAVEKFVIDKEHRS